MAILFQTTEGDLDAWLSELRSRFPDDEFRVWPDMGDTADIEFVIGWRIPVADIARCTNARALLVLGAGVNHLQPLEDIPDIPIVRLVDVAVAKDMASYALHWVLHYHRQMDRYRDNEATATWERHHYVAPDTYTVGVLGLGNIGLHIANALLAQGYKVRGWSRSGRTHDGVESFAEAELTEFLSGTDALINVLPVTTETTGLVGASTLALLNTGSVVINMGRAVTMDDAAVIDALDSGHLAGAVLDVFSPEPLSQESSLWAHPKVRVTPHISGSTFPRSAAAYIADNIDRIRAGEDPFPVFDRIRGY